ncbi:MAG: hypothetical protein EA420_10970 [Candidatus Competibacteraceae bacterium]|nr:MAG: hypothetical protein EA420_10970 [Candidatus Competibacteraceae bacterium]
MIVKNKGRDRWHGATQKTSVNQNVTAIRSSIKAAIVRLAVWGLIPVEIARWLIQRGGLKDA